jgi:Holliday junction DNA helicase RuvA
LYEYLEGRQVAREPGRLVLDVGGVGYEIAVPLSADFPAGPRTRVWTHLVVREDARLLYGFAARAERDLFRLLLSARGVGPATALAILSRLTLEELAAAVAAGDPLPLERVKGVGRKTAEQILLDLRGKPGLAAAALGTGAALVAPNTALADAAAALVSIGFADKEARRAVERAVASVGSADLEQLVRAALAQSGTAKSGTA